MRVLDEKEGGRRRGMGDAAEASLEVTVAALLGSEIA